MVMVYAGVRGDAPVDVRGHGSLVSAARVEVRGRRAGGLVATVHGAAVEHDADDPAVSLGVRVVVAHHVGVVVVRVGVAAALVHEQVRADGAAGAGVEESRLARADVNAAGAVTAVGAAGLARVRGAGVARRGGGGAPSKTSLEGTVDELAIRGVAHGSELGGRGRDGGDGGDGRVRDGAGQFTGGRRERQRRARGVGKEDRRERRREERAGRFRADHRDGSGVASWTDETQTRALLRRQHDVMKREISHAFFFGEMRCVHFLRTVCPCRNTFIRVE